MSGHVCTKCCVPIQQDLRESYCGRVGGFMEADGHSRYNFRFQQGHLEENCNVSCIMHVQYSVKPHC